MTQAQRTVQISNPEGLEGPYLIHRQIFLEWVDGVHYEAIIMMYDYATGYHTVVYKADETIEDVNLLQVSWQLCPRRGPDHMKPVLEGTMIRFYHPNDLKWCDVAVYDFLDGGRKLKVFHPVERKTENIKCTHWMITSFSPCLLQGQPISIDTENTFTYEYRDFEEGR